MRFPRTCGRVLQRPQVRQLPQAGRHAAGDFSKGPVWNPERNRWLVEIRYPDGSRLRKRLRREREALRIWSAEQTKIENGTWHEQAPKTVTFETALKQYREYSRVQNRSHDSYIEPALSVWEAHIKAKTLLAKITPALIEDVKLRRAQDVARSTVDKDLAVLKAFFNWCVARNLAASNPVRRVKLFQRGQFAAPLPQPRGVRPPFAGGDARSRRRPTSRRRSSWRSTRACAAAACSTFAGIRLTSLNRVVRIPRTKSGRPLSLPLNATVLTTLQTLLRRSAMPDCPVRLPARDGPKAGEPVQDVKNGFHTALETAEIKDFTWHDLRHTFASWLIMKRRLAPVAWPSCSAIGARMAMRYAHLSPAYLSAEVGLLDRAGPPPRQGAQQRKGQEKGNVPRSGISGGRKSWNFRREMAPQAGFEPATLRLTAGCSTVELLRNAGGTPAACTRPAGMTKHPS